MKIPIRWPMPLTQLLLTFMFVLVSVKVSPAQTNVLQSTGNAGVGTTTPESILTVQTSGGDTDGSKYVRIKNTNSFTGLLFDPNQSGDAKWVLMGGYPNIGDFTIREYGVANYFTIKKTTGYVGIGTSNPSRPLEVLAADGEAARLYRNGNGAGWGVNLKFSLNNSSGGQVDYAGLHGIIENNAAGSHGGSLLFTTATSGSLTEKMRLSSAGYFGIGSNAPWNKLTVLGTPGNREGISVAGQGNTWIYTDLNITPIDAGIASGKPINFAWSARKDAYYGGDSSGPSLVMEIARQGGGAFVPFIINPNGNVILEGASNATNANVGIGTTAPGAKLHLSAGDYSYALFGPNATWGGYLAVGSGASLVTPIAGRAQVVSSNGNLHLDGGVGQNVYISWLTPTSTIINGQGGNVGIGTSTPNSAYKLDVQNGQINASGGLCIGGDCKTAWSQVGGGSSQWTTSGSNIYYNTGSVGIGTNAPGGTVDFRDSSNRQLILSNSANGSHSFFNAPMVAHVSGNLYWNQGQLGWNRFDTSKSGSVVAARGDIGGIDFLLAPAGSNPVTAFNTAMRIDGSGNVGIGTTTPASNLQIGTQTSGPSATPTTLSLGGSYSNAAGSNLKLKLYDDGNAANTYGIGVSSSTMDFGVHPSAGYKWYAGGVNKMTLTSNGDLSVSGNIAAKYQDVAEWVPSAEQLTSGTVVVLDTSKSNQVTASTTAYDTRVAGVISAQPGITLGEKSENKVLVATTGRVRVKVDASRAPINIGDLLVTSDVPGVAMKSEPVEFAGRKMHMPGTIIGKALEPLAKGSGEILVLLSLQ